MPRLGRCYDMAGGVMKGTHFPASRDVACWRGGKCPFLVPMTFE